MGGYGQDETDLDFLDPIRFAERLVMVHLVFEAEDVSEVIDQLQVGEMVLDLLALVLNEDIS